MDQESQAEIFFEQAIEDFQDAIKIGGGSEPALKRLAQGLVRFAQAQLVHNTDVLDRLKRIEDSLSQR